MLQSSILSEKERVIFLVDDEPDNLRVLSEILQARGYKIRKAISGTLALAAIERVKPDLILLDINLPDINGYDLCKKLKNSEFVREIPIIFISALGQTESKLKAFQVGGVDYVTKPFQEEEVLVRVEHQLSLRFLQQELADKNNLLEEKNKLLEQEVCDRRQSESETRLLLTVSQTLEKAADLDMAFQEILRILCRSIHWDFAEAWVPNEEETTLDCHVGYYAQSPELTSFREESCKLRFNLGEGLPGRVWQSKAPEYFSDLSTVPESVFCRCYHAAQAGLKVVLGIPILDETETVFAVLVFFAKQPLKFQARAFQLIFAVAFQLGSLLRRKQAEYRLKQEQEKTEKLLLNILPAPIAQRLYQGETVIADRVEEASILFADLVNFTDFSSRKTPLELVKLLDRIFSEFDLLAQKYCLEKIKTIGDAYMVVGGLPGIHCAQESSSPVEAIARMALDMLTAMQQFREETGEVLQIRVGIHVGEVVAGVIGLSKFSYDLWGDAVNLASRLQSSSLPDEIQVTSEVYKRLHKKFFFQKRELVRIKGKGQMDTYFLKGMIAS
ncbi:adenylate/guanylate cyclase domain-containing protein [Oscillatoria sp. FACHB-1406]|uniref:adenylate/guanylate cyclase domain-containing protein n=1 Tax=Oscillatoria sp. FACHB-1406 TaxID=2692846 RepID=UPI001683631C|nr:adenylate/guanylate cyclase domain-containing protein [Oscillatoria sp. FACHB-1406]MBD2579147.1 response regulator [Oscillatoria sp. FACHB-1406]